MTLLAIDLYYGAFSSMLCLPESVCFTQFVHQSPVGNLFVNKHCSDFTNAGIYRPRERVVLGNCRIRSS